MPTDNSVPQFDFFEEASRLARRDGRRVVWQGASPLFGGLEVAAFGPARRERPCQTHKRRNCGSCQAFELEGDTQVRDAGTLVTDFPEAEHAEGGHDGIYVNGCTTCAGYHQHLPAWRDPVEPSPIDEAVEAVFGSAKPDFRFENHGSIAFIRPLNDGAVAWVEEHIGQDNGYQPQWPTVLVEHRFAEAILEGILADGFLLESEVAQ